MPPFCYYFILSYAVDSFSLAGSVGFLLKSPPVDDCPNNDDVGVGTYVFAPNNATCDLDYAGFYGCLFYF